MEPKETTTVEGSGEEEQHVKEQQPDEQQPDEGWVLIDKTDTENAEQNSGVFIEALILISTHGKREKWCTCMCCDDVLK